MARSLFSYVVYDLDARRIVDFRLKPWADRFLVLRSALYENESGSGVSLVDAPEGTKPLSPDIAPEGFGNETVHTLDMVQMEHEVLDWVYPDRHERRPICYNHLPAQERNAEIVRRRKNGESLTSLARELGITVQRVWYIVMRGR